MRVDQQNGTVHLPSGLVVTPELTQDAFRESPMFAQAKSSSFHPWIHFRFSGGAVEDKPLYVSLCFHDQTLVSLDLTADLYPPDAEKSWSSYSLETEAATKEFHERLLEQLLSRRAGQGSNKKTLQEAALWKFPWGSVGSSHDPRGGGTSITVSYARTTSMAK